MLDLHRVDLGELAVALEDHSYDHSWWLDLETARSFSGATISLSRTSRIPSRESFAQSKRSRRTFIERVRDPRARDLLERGVAGRGAFRRFKDTLLDFPDLRDSWFRFHDAQLERRAIRWLLDEGLIDEASAASALAERPEPELPLLSGTFDPHEIAREVARDLRRMYGDRLRAVLLFGSWARGDAHPESDIDLLVVLDRVESVWDELRQMDPILWKHSFANDTVVMAVPVSSDAFEERRRPVVARAQAEGLPVG